jgi:hypothetical protein
MPACVSGELGHGPDAADLRERSNGVCDGTGVSWSVVTQFLTQSAACLLGIFPALTCGAGVLTDGLVRDVLVLVQFWRRHPDHWAEGVTEAIVTDRADQQPL